MSRNGQRSVQQTLYSLGTTHVVPDECIPMTCKDKYFPDVSLITDHSEKEVEEFICRLLHCCENFQNKFLTIVMRDFNAKVSKGRAEESWNLGEKNGQGGVECCGRT